MAKGGKGKGKKGGKKGGAKGGSASHTGATGVRLQPPSNFAQWKPELMPVVHRPAPSLVPHRPAPEAPAPILRLPVHVVRAALAEDQEVVLAWVLGGGSIDATWDRPDGSARGFTLLMLACVRGLLSLVETLLRRGARTGPKNSAGATALIIAAHHGRRSIVHRLLQAGARTDVRANPPQGIVKGPTAFDVADRNGHVLVAELLRTHDLAELAKPPAELPDCIAEAAASGETTTVVEWIEVGGPVDAPHRPTGGRTMLLLAAEKGHEACVDALLKRRASTAVTTHDGSTAMMVAAYSGHAAVTRRLLQHQLRHREPPAFVSPRGVEQTQQFVQSEPIPEYALEFRKRHAASEGSLRNPGVSVVRAGA